LKILDTIFFYIYIAYIGLITLLLSEGVLICYKEGNHIGSMIGFFALICYMAFSILEIVMYKEEEKSSHER